MTTDMKTCSTCKHWGNLSKYWDDSKYKLKRCDSEKYLIGYLFEEEEFGDSDVNVEGDEGWGFRTGPLFGCIHHEERLDTNASK